PHFNEPRWLLPEAGQRQAEAMSGFIIPGPEFKIKSDPRPFGDLFQVSWQNLAKNAPPASG
ncbi:MAG: hypothetical protein ACP5Q3_10560, partial [bacterium]